MTKIKLCGLTRPEEILAANDLQPDYVGFVFVPGSKRYITPRQGESLRQLLSPGIFAVGVFVNEAPEQIAALLRQGVIDMAQLHGREDAAYIRRLRRLADGPILQAVRMETAADAVRADRSIADYVLLDSGAGTGTLFDWNLAASIRRPYFLAGGLGADSAARAVRLLHPFAVDVSSGIETNGVKDIHKMAAFVAAVREEDAI